MPYCRPSRCRKPAQPRIVALTIIEPYSELGGWRIEPGAPCDPAHVARVRRLGYRIAEAPISGFGRHNAVIYCGGINYLATLDPAPTERPAWPPRPELAEVLRLNRG